MCTQLSNTNVYNYLILIYTPIVIYTNLSATHPHTESKFDVFAAPDAKSFVERSDGVEVVLTNGDGAANQRWREVWLAGGLDSTLLVA